MATFIFDVIVCLQVSIRFDFHGGAVMLLMWIYCSGSFEHFGNLFNVTVTLCLYY